MSARRKVIFLYTELAPYFLACLERLVNDHAIEVHLVRWPLNDEAPFNLQFPAHVHEHVRTSMDDDQLLKWAQEIDPDIVFASGWVDRGYLKLCRAMRQNEVPTVMCSDTAWKGTAKQRAAVAMAMFWIKGTFSHAWVTGRKQSKYARKLGFRRDRIRTGFYSADVSKFAPLAGKFLAARNGQIPHRFLCVARYIPSKGLGYLVEAFAELCDANEAADWQLTCVGTGELYPMAHSHPRIEHVGFIQADDIWEVEQKCGVFVLPSLFEPWGVVVHEHALAGFPLLLSDAVGAGERFLRKGVNGERFVAGNKASLRTAFRTMIARSDEELMQMGASSAELGLLWDPKRWASIVIDLMDAS